MTLPELPDASDADIDAICQIADPLVLRGLLYLLTGADTSVVAVTPQVGIDAAKLANDADAAILRAQAAALLKQIRDGLDVGNGAADRIARSLALSAGVDEVPPEDLDIWIEELALAPYARGVERHGPPPAGIDELEVVVIGAGMGGLNAAAQLKHAGIGFTLLDKNSGVGGTWYENRYPGARVDSPSRAYLHILGVDYHPTHPFCPREQNERYFSWMAEHFALLEHIRLNTEVTSLTWDDDDARWEVCANGPDGELVLHPQIVITAVGLLSRPSIPAIAGREDFTGPAFHSSWWPADLDISDKRVGVIGTGCSGVQLVPVVADLAPHVTVFQRTPQWLFDNPGYLQPYPPEVNWLDRNLPTYSNFMRFRSNWLLGPYLSEPKRLIDPDFDDPHARSAVNKRLRDERVAYITQKLASQPELIEKMIPPHPPFSARPVMVDRDDNLYDALLRDDVSLVTDGIDRITANGIRTVDGTEHELDVIVFATGFRANEALWPMEVYGRDGKSVLDLWSKDGPRAYLGAMLPDFPNLFMVYGPNMNPYGGLGVVNLEEMVMRYTLACIDHLVANGKRTIEPTEDAYREWNGQLDAREERKIYRDPRARSYYINEHGRSATNCPFTGIEMWHRLRHPDHDDLIVR